MQAKGKKLGEAVSQGRPELPKRLILYWSAFASLHRRRQLAYMGPQPISFTDMQAYLTLCFNHDSAAYRARFIRFISAMDDAYLADFSENQKNKGS